MDTEVDAMPEDPTQKRTLPLGIASIKFPGQKDPTFTSTPGPTTDDLIKHMHLIPSEETRITMTAETLSKRTTDNAIADARKNVAEYTRQLCDLTGSLDPQRLVEITASAALGILLTAVADATPKMTENPTADNVLRQALHAAALMARSLIPPAASCNVQSLLPHTDPNDPDSHRRHLPKALASTARAAAQTYRDTLYGCTASLQGDSALPVKQQVGPLATHVSSVVNVAANIDAIMEQMPTRP